MTAERIGLLFCDVAHESAETRRRFVELAIKQAQESGELEVDIELVERHTVALPGGRAIDAIREWKNLVDEDGVIAVIGTCHADTGISLVPTIDAGECATTLMGGDHHLVGKWAFNVQLGDMIQGAFAAMAWCHHHGYRNVALVRDTAWHANQWLEACQMAARRLDINILTVESLPSTQSAVDKSEDPQREAASGALKRIRDLAPDALVNISALGSLAVAQEMSVIDWDVPRVSASLGFETCRLPQCAELWQGWVGISVWDEANAAFGRMAESYEDAYGPRTGVWRDCIAVGYHDATRVILAALNGARVRNRSGLRDALEGLHYLAGASGAPSTIMGFTPYEHRAYHGPDTIVLRRQVGPTTRDNVLEGYLSGYWPVGR